ncbi:hypothetical protein D5S17_09440 [Pseudonocardiaceae bacterium YIM PH 21723]|nr:hypothetical protein D5S17_09440 [Pseudonocardiaceae bacterium YIM PH 21723]
MADARYGGPAYSGEYNKVLSNVRDLDTRSTATDNKVSQLDTTIGNQNTRINTLETNQGSRADLGPVYDEIRFLRLFVPAPVADDTALYGDTISSLRRSESYSSKTLANGYTTITATRSARVFNATELRVCVPAASEGSGSFTLKVYTGTSPDKLTEKATLGNTDTVTTAGMKRLKLDNIALGLGDYIAIGLLCSGYSTGPKFSATPAGAGAQYLIGETPYSVFRTGQSSLPGSVNLTDSNWTKANQLFWFALT